MKILFDNGTPVPLKNHLAPHAVTTAYSLKWHTKKNGDLIAAAEAAGFDCLVTTDKNLGYQQNLASRQISIVVLPTTRWPDIEAHVANVQQAIAQAAFNSFCEVVFTDPEGKPSVPKSL